jgi:hypothetical protein
MTVLNYRSTLEEFDPTRGRSGSWLSWAIYLGMSWTWCIGMFLPVILVRDYGIVAWFIFAVPNVVGAAAMAWVLKDRDSQSIVVAHEPIIRLFSMVTATFQIFFGLWMFEEMGASGAEFAMLVFALVVFRACRRDADVHSLASVVLMASLVTMLFQAIQGSLGLPFHVPLKTRTVLDLVSLIPVCFLGFLLCPYLDVTFHRARQHLPEHQSRAAFTIGFGFFFLLMIVYTLLYARLFDFNSYRGAGIIAHWIFQLGFTVGLHWFGLPREGERPRRVVAWTRIGVSLIIAAAVWVLTILGPVALDAEIIYRCFMGFYGLAFPAYVWLCMIPGRGRLVPTHRQLMVCGITILVALPFYWLGFVEKRMLWLFPGVAIVLLARLLIKRADLKVQTQEQPALEGETFA